MRVLVTGGAGFLGRAFLKYHASRGDHVVAIDDFSSPYAYWPNTMFEAINADVGTDGLDHAEDTGAFDIAYHFAAPVGGREKIEGDPLFNADSLRLDAKFFRWATKHDVTTAVYPSSSAVYGTTLQGRSGRALAERMFRPSDASWLAPDEIYGLTKLTGEVLAWKSATYGLNVLCIRPFSGYGEDQSLEYPVPSIAQRVARREDPLIIWGSGSQRRDFIHVDDLVRATVTRVEAGVRGYDSMNIGSGFATSFREVAEMLAHIADYRPVIDVDRDKPEGVQNRWADTDRMSHYYIPRISLRDGLERVLRAQERVLDGTFS